MGTTLLLQTRHVMLSHVQSTRLAQILCKDALVQMDILVASWPRLRRHTLAACALPPARQSQSQSQQQSPTWTIQSKKKTAKVGLVLALRVRAVATQGRKL